MTDPQYQRITQKFRDYTRDLVVYPATEEDLLLAEDQLGVRLPLSYRQFQLEFGDYQGGPVDIWAVISAKQRGVHSINVEPWKGAGTIVDAAKWQRAGASMDSLNCCLPEHLVPIAETDDGDLYCLDTTDYQGNECSVKLWVHEDGQLQLPVTVANTFLDWLEQEITRTQNDAT